MTNVIMSTEYCYEGYHSEEDSYVIGSYSDLYSDDHIDYDTIEFSQMDWEAEKNHFFNYLQKEMERYEKRYKTSVTHFALVGTVGRWNGSPIGGKLIDYNENPIDHMGRVDEIEVVLNEDKTFTILGHHHDGTHRMDIYFMTENKLNKVVPDFVDYGNYDYQDIERIYEEYKPFKATTICADYYGAFNNKAVA